MYDLFACLSFIDDVASFVIMCLSHSCLHVSVIMIRIFGSYVCNACTSFIFSECYVMTCVVARCFVN